MSHKFNGLTLKSTYLSHSFFHSLIHHSADLFRNSLVSIWNLGSDLIIDIRRGLFKRVSKRGWGGLRYSSRRGKGKGKEFRSDGREEVI